MPKSESRSPTRPAQPALAGYPEGHRTVTELRREFAAAVKDYLVDCEEQGLSPEKPASGKLLIRVPPEVHRQALIKAQAMGKSLNPWATEALEQAVRAEG